MALAFVLRACIADQPILVGRDLASISLSLAAGAAAPIPSAAPSTTCRSISNPSPACWRAGRDASRTLGPLAPAPAGCVRTRVDPEGF